MTAKRDSEIGAGTVIADSYEVTRLIGQGGMGAVWAAKHLRLPGKRVAVKVLHGGQTIDQEAFARFRREAEIASRIGHPNIVEVIDFNVLPSGTPYLVLEFLEGESLAQRLKRGPMPLAAALALVRQVGSALHAAHRAEVVHRDLKPDNIFLYPTDSGGVISDRVKVLDFGISKIRGSTTVQTQEAALLGTPQYMSPEQALGKNKSIDQRTDIFALGAIVYEMLTGTRAFSGDTLAAVVLAIVHEPSPTLKGKAKLPAHVIDAVDGALKKEPDERFADMRSFIGALTGQPLEVLDPPSESLGLADTAPEAARPSEGAIAPKAVSQRRKLYWLALGGGPVLAGAIGLSFLHSKTQPRAVPKEPQTPPVVMTPDAKTTKNAVGADANHDQQPISVAIQKKTPPIRNKPASKRHSDSAKRSGAELPEEVTTDLVNAEKAPVGIAAELDSAEKALAAGKTADAIRLARHSFLTEVSARGYAIITRAFCRERNLDDAKANFAHVGSERASVVRACSRDGIELP